MISPSGNIHHDQALGTEDRNATGLASNRGNPIGHVLLEETESDTGVNLLETLTHTLPRSKSPSPFSCNRGWAMMGRGIGMRREGVENSTL